MSVLKRFVLPIFLAGVSAAALAAEGEWVEVARSPEVTVYRKEMPDTSIYAYKADANLAAPMDRVVSVVMDTARRPEWAERVRSATLLQRISPTEHIEHVVTRIPWPLKDRDFVVRSRLIPDPATRSLKIQVQSVEHPAAPVSGKYVRGIIHKADFILKPLDGGKSTYVTSESHVDPKGSIPSWVINLIQKSFPRKSIANILRQTAKPDIKPHPVATEVMR